MLSMFVLAFTFYATAQWPGNFYSFILKDPSGKTITPENTEYKITPVGKKTDVVLGIEFCNDSKVWRFSEGGNHYMGSTQELKIENHSSEMIIEFPSSMSGGKEQYYRNLYAGIINFKKGITKIKLPHTDAQWDNIKEIKLCIDGINFTSFYDISEFQQE